MPQNVVVTSNDLCLKTEEQLARMTGELLPDLNKGFTFNAMATIEDSTDSGSILSQQAMTPGARPGDATCTSRNMDVKYMLPDCAQVANDCSTADVLACNDEPVASLTYETTRAVVEKKVCAQWSLDANTFGCRCEDWFTEFSTIVRRKIETMMREYQRGLVETIYAGSGTSYDGVNSNTVPKKLKLFDSQARPQPTGLFSLDNEFADQAPNAGLKPVLLSGSDKLRNAGDHFSLFRTNQDGRDISNAPNLMLPEVNYDRDVARIFQANGIANGTEWVMSWLPGAFDVLEWFNFDQPLLEQTPGGRHIYAPVQNSGTLLRQKIDWGTPIIGRPFIADTLIRYDECTNRVHYTLEKWYDVWKIPANAFCSTYNYCLTWDIVCEDFVCADNATASNINTINPLPA